MPTKRLRQVNNSVGETVHCTEIIHSVKFVLGSLFKMETAVEQWLGAVLRIGRSLVRSQLVSLEFLLT